MQLGKNERTNELQLELKFVPFSLEIPPGKRLLLMSTVGMPVKPCSVLMIESSVNEKKALELSASLNILSIIASEKKTFQPGNRPETKLY